MDIDSRTIILGTDLTQDILKKPWLINIRDGTIAELLQALHSELGNFTRKIQVILINELKQGKTIDDIQKQIAI